MSEWQQSLRYALAANVPALVVGPPGVGKTSHLNQVGRELGWPTETVISSIREPSDFLGLPLLDGEGVRMAPPGWAQRLAREGTSGGLLVLDEITTAPPAVQAALLRVVLERVVGDLPLPGAVRVVALANSADQAGGWDLSMPLNNRFVHLEAPNPGVSEWTNGLMVDWEDRPTGGLGLIAPGLSEIGRAKNMVRGYLTGRPENLTRPPKNEDKATGAWPSPRTWHILVRLLGWLETNPADELVNMSLIVGCVGSGVGGEFLTWRSKLDLPNPEEVLLDPSKFTVPKRTDVTFAVLGSVVSFAVERMKVLAGKPEAVNWWNGAWEIVGAVANAGKPDVAVPVGSDLAKHRKPEFPRPPNSVLKAIGDLLEVGK